MTKITEYLERKFENPYLLYLEESVESDLYSIISTTGPEREKEEFQSMRINKSTIEFNVMEEYQCWEKVPEGFEFRNNFHFNEETGELEFDTSRILKTESGYISDGSEISDAYMSQESSKKMLENLANINKTIQEKKEIYWLEYEDTVQDKKIRFERSEPHKKMFVIARINHLKKYLQEFGEKGKELLIRWLNLLSNPEQTLDELYIQFLYDISKADEYFDCVLETKNMNYRFEHVLLSELDTFSPRGRRLKNRFYSKERKATETK